MKKKILAGLLSLVMILSLLPITALADNERKVSNAEEFAKAIATGGDIKLGADIDYAPEGDGVNGISISGETTIDLAGKKLNITTPTTTRYSIDIPSTASFTIKDTSEAGSGEFNVKSLYTSKVSYIFGLYGILDIQGGTINQTASKASSTGIYLNGGGTFKMSGGTLKKGVNFSSGYTLRTGSTSTSTITGGVVEDYYGTTGLQISGGIFKTEPTYEWMAPGKVTYKITEEGTYKGWYGVKDGTYVGLVGTTMYTDIAEFAKAIGGSKIDVEGTKLTLNDDIDLGSSSSNKITLLSDITIDLAGHSITGQVNGSSAHMLYIDKKEANVTITDSVGGGLVKNSGLNATSTKYAYTIGVNKGTLVVNNGVTLEAYTSQSNPASTVSTYPTVIKTTAAGAKVVLNGANIKIDCAETKRASACGIDLYTNEGSVCEIDNSTIDVTSGSSATGIKVAGTSSVLKVGSKDNGKTAIKAKTTGLNDQVPNVYGIGNGSTGVKGNIFISNVDITVTGNEGGGNQSQTNGGVRFASTTYGTYEIGNNVSILVDGTLASGKTSELYGIYAAGGASITGSNVHIDVEGENAAKRYGLYKSDTNPFIINPGTDVTVTVNESGSTTGTNYITYAGSTGLFEIAGGTYKGGELNGMIVTGGVFDSDPSDFCELGYVAQADTPSAGLFTVVPDTRTVVKNLTQDKEYGNIVTAIAEAKDHDELQLMEDISSKSELTLASVNLDLNGHDISLNKINTTGDVTITDKQATNYDNAGELTGAINVGTGNTLISKCKHSYATNAYKNKPFTVKGEEGNLANLTISGVKGEYSFDAITQYYAIATNADSRVTINNEEGFVTDLKLESSGQNPKLIDASGSNNEATINGGKFYVTCSGTTAGVSYVFGNNIKALVNDGEFKIESQKNTGSRISGSANPNLDLQGGYFVGIDNSSTTPTEATKDDFFANASYLGQNGKNSVNLETSDPMYTAGYRYTLMAVPVAKIGSQEFTSIQSAIIAATEGQTIELLSDTVARELILDKNVTFEANDYTVKLVGDKPLTLGNGIEKPDCFDASEAQVYIEKKSGEKKYYKYFIAYTSPNSGAIVDYDATTDAKMVLTKDMPLTSSLTIYKECAIDLNGFKIEGAGCQYETLCVKPGTAGPAKCTIMDSSSDKTGQIIGKTDYYTVCIYGKGCSFTLESGEIINTATDGAGICAIGDAYAKCEDTTITINGGKVITKNGFAYCDNGQYSKNIALNINGGEITSTGVTMYHPANGTITLNKGTITGGTCIYMRSGELSVPKDSKIVVKATGKYSAHDPTYSGGALLTGDAVVIDVSGYPCGDPSADICGGAFYSKNAYAVASYALTGKTAITGFLKGGIYGADSKAIDISNKNLIASGYRDIQNPDTTTKEDHPWMIGEVGSDVQTEIVVEHPATTDIGEKVEKNEQENAEKVLESVAVKGVADALTEKGQEQLIKDAEKTNKELPPAIKTAKQIQIDIAVEAVAVEVKTVKTVSETKEVITFELTPYAIVTAIQEDGTTVSSETVRVENDYLSKNAKKPITVVLGTTFEPAQVLHYRANGEIEAFKAGATASYAKKTYVYDKNANTVTLQILDFSEVKLLKTAIAEHEVSFDANGGKGTMPTQKIVNGSAFYLPECEFTAPENKKFSAWQIGLTKYNPGDKIEITKATKIKAVWEDVTPKTGDQNNIGLFVGLGGVALLAIIVLAVIMLKKKTYR